MATRPKVGAATRLRSFLAVLGVIAGMLMGTQTIATVVADSAIAAANGQAIVDDAASQSGTPYCWGGGDTSGPTHGAGGSWL